MVSSRVFLSLLSSSLLVKGLQITEATDTFIHPADSDLLCYKSLEDCYPVIFVPTNDFKQVRPGQQIPKGLHVRMDFETGLKEAKIYVPSEDEDESLQAVEVIPGETVHGDIGQSPEHESVQDTHAPLLKQMADALLQNQGSVSPPASIEEDTAQFDASVHSFLHSHHAPEEERHSSLFQSLSGLEELAHDIYWGIEKAKNRDLAQRLLAHLDTTKFNSNITKKSAAVIGAAIQNNPTALSEFSKHENLDKISLLQTVFQNTMQLIQDNDLSPSHVLLLSGLLQDFETAQYFVLTNHYSSALREVVGTRLKQKSLPGQEKFLVRVAHLLQDRLFSLPSLMLCPAGECNVCTDSEWLGWSAISKNLSTSGRESEAVRSAWLEVRDLLESILTEASCS